MVYQRILKPILFRIDPEYVHRAIVPLGEQLGRTTLTRHAVSLVYGYTKDDARVTVDGITYHTPLVLSAGFDPNGQLVEILPSVAFGGIEVGSVTARPCAGNKPPNQTRLKRTRSILVNKGLRNEGVESVTTRLLRKRRIPGFAIGISIARTNDTESCTLDAGIEDYAQSMRTLTEKRVGDWITINISCPNTYTGELFTEPSNLDLLLGTLDQIRSDRPMYLKMPISVSTTRFTELADVAARHRVRGLIIGNLQKDYRHIQPGDPHPTSYAGGLSGVPCREDSNTLLSLAHDTYGDRFTLIGCGGVFSVDDAMEKFDRGAQLIHMITGMIYTGPALMSDIARAYAARMGHAVRHAME